MKIIIFGGSGFIGQALVSELQTEHELAVVGRSKTKLNKIFNAPIVCMAWTELDAELLSQFDIAINLVGENIGDKYWTSKQKQKIINSRVEATTKLAQMCTTLGDKAPRLFNANAIGIYGLPPTIEQQQATYFDENSEPPSPPSDFLSQVGVEWHRALAPASNVVELRFAVVLSKKGGVLAKMLPAFKLGLGAVFGSGEQPFSWVALSDVVAAIKFLIHHPIEKGVFNVVADEVVSQRQFADELASELKRPRFLWLPAGIVKLMFGQMGEELLLNGQRVKAKHLHNLGFEFQHKTLRSALKG